MQHKVLDMQCEIAEMVHEKFLQEVYSMSACPSDYDEGRIEELRLLIGLKRSGVLCPEKKAKIHAAMAPKHFTSSTPITFNTSSIVVFTFIQPTPAGTWVIAHNLGYNPPVQCIDNHGNLIAGQVVYLDLNTLQIIFPFITGGTAHLYNA